MTLGSLFDGSGGFPLAGLINGIEPIWASEIEPFPIRVTTKRFPQMQHLGDISKLKGAEIPPVDIITFGSPCQSMSSAGKREGLKHIEYNSDETTRSGLFFEAIRIIKEMREATNGKYPRFAIWENVTGAFSSNKGYDFYEVLKAFCSIKGNGIDVPQPKKSFNEDKLTWRKAGIIVGNNFSIAWRTLDAQYWGVPQRRRRIFLVADFGSECAGEILFKSEGVSRNIKQGKEAWQGVTQNTIHSIETSSNGVACIDNVGGKAECYQIVDKSHTLKASHCKHPSCVLQASGFCTEHSAESRSIGYEEERSPTLRAGVTPAVFAIENHPNDSRVKFAKDNKVQTLTSHMGTGGGNVPLLMLPQSWNGEQVMSTVNKSNPKAVCYGISAYNSNAMLSDNPHSGIYEANTSRTLDGNGGNPACNQGGIAVVCVDQGGGKSACNITENVSPTLTCTHGEEPVVCLQGSMIGRKDNDTIYSMPTGTWVQVNENIASSLLSRDYKDAQIVTQLLESDNCEIHYVVRRLTPTECARLQGFPDWWCSDLATENPTEEEIAFWVEVWETYHKIMGVGKKPKSRKQIITWLKKPYSDTAEYKMWGNGVALPCVTFILSGIAEVLSKEGN